MTIVKVSPKKDKIEIDLSGPQGNSFYLLGIAQKLSQQLGLNYNAICKEMISGDYNNLVKTLDKNFGNFIIIYNFKES